ncbi:hypothetical protein [Paenibacillus sp. FSL E2-0190]|uniref:phage tail protein n=1 Tax=Paenibacillus sp. FSL E2-0190 TaxID=2954504 RepID=UPI0030EEA875
MATIDELRILITAETRGLRDGIRDARREVGNMERDVKKATDGMGKAFKAVAAAIAALGIAKLVKDAVNAASELESAMAGLTSIVVGHGLSMKSANQYIQDYIKDGLVPLTSAVTAYKNLAARGYTEDQIQTVMTRLKDSAAFGRQASYTLGKAVETATEGLKNENSILVDNAGVTKNVAKMWLDYAKAHGIAYTELTKQQKIEAEVQGIIEETKFQVGDAAKYTETYAGRIAMLTKTMKDIQVSMGQAFMPIANVILPLLQTLANAVARVASYIASFMQALFGVSKGQTAQAASANQAAAAQINVGDAAEGAGKKAKKAAKEAKGAVAAFDEINQLADKSGSGSGSDSEDSGASGSGIGDLDLMPGINDFTAAPIPEAIQAAADEAKRILNELGAELARLWTVFSDAWSGLRPALQPLIDMKEPIMAAVKEMGKTFAQLRDETLIPIGKYILLDFIPSIVVGFTKSFAPVIANEITWAFQEFAKTFQNVTDVVGGLWSGTWLPALENVKVAFLEAMPSIAASIQSLLDNTINPFVDFMLNQFLIPIAAQLNETFVPIFSETLVWAIQEFASVVGTVVATVNELFTTTLMPAVTALRDAFMQVIPEIGGTLQSLLNGTIKPFVSYMINDFIIPIVSKFTSVFIPLFSETLVWAIQEFSKIFKNVTDTVNSLWNDTWLPAIDKLKNAYIDSMDKIGGSIKSLLDNTLKPFVDYAINDFILPIVAEIENTLVPMLIDNLVWGWKEVAKAFEWAVNLINDIWTSTLMPIFELIKEIVLDTLEVLKEAWDEHGNAILDKLSEVMDNILATCQRLWDEILKPIIIPFLEMLKEMWEGTLKGVLKQTVELVLKLVEAATDIYNKFIHPIVGFLIDLFGPAFVTTFKEVFAVVKSTVKTMGEVISGLFEILGGLIDFITGVFTGDWKKAWEGIKSIFKGIVDTLWPIIKIPFNFIIDGINTIVDGINSISIDIPEVDVFGKKIGGGSIGLPHIERIPRLARGGIVDSPTVAMIGEAGKEAVIPLENTSFVNTLASALGSAVMAAMQMGGSSNSAPSGGGDIVVQVDGTTLARIINPYLSQEQGRIGGTILTTA